MYLMEKIRFKTENDVIEFYVLEHTKVGGNDYILVTDSEAGEDGDALILKETKTALEKESIYEIVSDEIELNAVAAVFNSLLEDTVIEEI